jgi:hypothetical protein
MIEAIYHYDECDSSTEERRYLYDPLPLSAAPNKPNCPPLPNHPDWASPSTDIKSLQGGWNNIDAVQILNFKRMVQTGGPMDYKQYGDYVDFGNFNFGYVGAGLGMPDEMLRWGAGYANWHDNPQNRPIYGSPFDPNNHTHGDQPGDQAQINAGIAAYKAGCHY